MNTDEYLYMTNTTVIFANLLVYMTMHILCGKLVSVSCDSIRERKLHNNSGGCSENTVYFGKLLILPPCLARHLCHKARSFLT